MISFHPVSGKMELIRFPRRCGGTFFLSEIIMSNHGDMELRHLTLGQLDMPAGMASHADPEVLARAVRAHKIGDALAQAALTFALMLAIGAVAFVLSADHAAAASLIVHSMIDNSAVVAGIALAGIGLLVARRAALRLVRVRAPQRRR